MLTGGPWTWWLPMEILLYFLTSGSHRAWDVSRTGEDKGCILTSFRVKVDFRKIGGKEGFEKSILIS